MNMKETVRIRVNGCRNSVQGRKALDSCLQLSNPTMNHSPYLNDGNAVSETQMRQERKGRRVTTEYQLVGRRQTCVKLRGDTSNSLP